MNKINVVIPVRGHPNDPEALKVQLKEMLKDFQKRLQEIFFSQSIRQDGVIEIEFDPSD